MLAFVVAGLSILVIYRIVGRLRPSTVSRGFRLGQIISGSLFSLSHGTNDAQKTMGIIFLALVANGNLNSDAEIPTWVIVSSATAIAARHLRRRLADHQDDGQPDHQDGPGAGLRGPGRGRRGDPDRLARRLPALDHAGHLGRDHGRRARPSGVSAVRWGVAGNIVVAWVLTLPASALVGARHLPRSCTCSATARPGPVVVSAGLLIALGVAMVRRVQLGARPLTAEGVGVLADDRGRAALEVVWVSLLAGVVVSVLFSLVVLFGARSAESRRAGAGDAAMAYGAIAVHLDGRLRRDRGLRRAHHAVEGLAGGAGRYSAASAGSG